MLAANPFATEALTRLWDRIAISSLSNLTSDADWSGEVHRHHRDIVAAITEGAPEQAARAARDHIARAAEVYGARPH
ncbi:FCD domain-containing protein [Streptosporangium algeriense]|uniref:FCD domain-containing protein n=1 Tax=Streptosporangium algeriense TaxID=1682748 RepID=A0ABW3DVD9_9ACTN